jgi:hypothetical protein
MVHLWNLYGTQLQPRMTGFEKISRNFWKEDNISWHKAEVWNLPGGGEQKKKNKILNTSHRGQVSYRLLAKQLRSKWIITDSRGRVRADNEHYTYWWRSKEILFVNHLFKIYNVLLGYIAWNFRNFGNTTFIINLLLSLKNFTKIWLKKTFKVPAILFFKLWIFNFLYMKTFLC